MDRAFILDSYPSNRALFHCQNKRLSGLEQFARRLRSGELRNKIMRIGLHGLCGYIKLERGRIGGAKGGHSIERETPGGVADASCPGR